MTTPTVKVEVGFDDGPLVASPTWTDVTAYVLQRDGIRISRGRNTEFDQATGTASFTLDNRDRRFDPTNTAGTYYGKLLPRRQVRITATWSGTTYNLFRGVVEGWPQVLPSVKEATVPIRCVDLLAVLGETELEDAAFVYAKGTGHLNGALRTMVNGLWFDEVGGLVMRRRQGTGTVGSKYAVGPGTPVETGWIGDTFYNENYYTVNEFFSARGVGWESDGYTKGSVSFWIYVPFGNADLDNYTSINIERSIMGTVSNSQVYTLITLYEGKVRFLGSGSSGQADKRSAFRVDNDAWHHVTVTIDGSTQKIYVDGKDVTTSVASASSVFQGINLIGTTQWSSTADIYEPYYSVIQDVFTFDDALTATEAKTLFELGRGELSESTSARMDRIMSAAGVPAGLYSATTVPQGTVAEIDLWDSFAVAEMQKVGDSEYARLFCAADGKITLHDRYWWKTQTKGNTVQLTLSDAPGSGEYEFTEVGLNYDDREVANRVTVTGSFGIRVVSEDATSQTAYGIAATSQSTLLPAESDVDSLADGILELRKDPVVRLDAIQLRPMGNAAAWPSILARELGDRFKVEVKPMNTGAQQAFELLTERLEWTIRDRDWTVSITGAPVPNYSLFILDSSILNGTDKLGF